jgi:hypothetical protein
MWLDGDSRLLAYFFLYEISGVMLALLLISFGATKHIRRYAYFVMILRRTDHHSFLGLPELPVSTFYALYPTTPDLIHSPVLVSMTVSWLIGAFPSAIFL